MYNIYTGIEPPDTKISLSLYTRPQNVQMTTTNDDIFISFLKKSQNFFFRHLHKSSWF